MFSARISCVLMAFFLFTMTSSGQKARGYTITGNLSGCEGCTVRLAPSAIDPAIDSAVIRNDRFVLKGRVPEADYYALLVEGKPGLAWFIVTNEPITLQGHADSLRQARLSGTSALRSAQELRAVIQPFFAEQSDSFDSAFAAHGRGDSVRGRQFEQTNKRITDRINDSIASFIQRDPSSFESLARLNELYKVYDRAGARRLFSGLSPALRQHRVGRQLRYELFEAEKALSIGALAPAFTQKDLSGRPVSLAGYRGKYVLIDFWASWCAPCRAEAPNVIKAWQQYRSRGFEVLGVSLDNNGAAWAAAVRTDSLPWVNVSDLKGFRNAAAQRYAVTAVPANFLLDPSGRIIATDLKGEALREKLGQIFGQ